MDDPRDLPPQRVPTRQPTLTNLTRPIDLASLSSGGKDRGLLMEMSGADAGHVHMLRDDVVTIGRGDDCVIAFADTTLSRVHARITFEGDDWVVADCGSLNGTYVNNAKIQRHVLAHGDRLRLGAGVRMLFQRVTSEEEDVLVQLYEASVRDGLTGMFNRRHLSDRLAQEVAYAVRHDTGVCVLLLDIDFFKKVNDTHGHLAGDEVLRRLAGLVGEQIRREDLLARYGGEEFVLVIREVPLASAGLLAERIRAAVERMEVPYEGKILRMTVSIGVASLASCGADRTPTHLLALADQALYRAKETGRNRVEIVEVS
jgi:diguanylate cyclase (GGDEF)-like protein